MRITAEGAMATELSETQILSKHGDLLWVAVSAFGHDPAYLADMVESADLIKYKREMWNARSEASKLASCPEEVREHTARIMSERGIVPPSNKRRRAA
jgi:hypothetical protein